MPSNKDQLTPEQLLRIVLDTIPLRVFWKDVDLNYLGANQKLLDDIGFKNLESLVGQSDYAIFDTQEEAEPKRDDDREVINSGKAKLDIEEALVIPGKPTKWLRTNKAPMQTEDGVTIGVLGTYQDITAEVEYRQQIERQALIDPLTGLENRRSIQNTIAQHDYTSAGLLFIDLDRFKQVNDTLGHSIGDELLKLVAGYFQRVADKHGASLARLGGDEFSIFKTFEHKQPLKTKLEAIAKDILETLNRPIRLEHNIVTIGASIGITELDGYSNVTKDGFTEADLAMYSAKRDGLNKYQFFSETLRVSAKRQHQLHAYLHRAVALKELYLVYQPQFDQNQRLIGAEALIRWRHPDLGEVSPADFIPVAEESGMIHEIGEWVIREALDALKNWQSLLSASPDFKLAINVSSCQFENKYLAEYIKNQLEQRELSGRHLEVEITESLLFKYKEMATTTMVKLKDSAISVAIDDFGTGYSSLSYLATLPLNKLKIDRSFITDLHNNPTNMKLVETLVNLAASLGLRVTAEGVETNEELVELKRLNCQEYQGFLFAKPISQQQFENTYVFIE
ncbi:EAL domain-containing protein [Bacterioplanoides sp. SCSIO 12839]|uniref:sensor domain-containing protein n=1 Tax=Bacterioplanoides sp. SCSIO 12839 TaxID=2829569 RepID=UPI0021040C22|nr:EAL domain-containing protein [Bacterioplanoides sp. SCSIO 12839]UTW48318.1 EAL domain-containing protein [Bacterioplanoides sp. SCSIO 12839]